MKEKILELRKQGKTYNEIQKELGCSKGTISYHCGEGQKEKYKQRTIKLRNTIKYKVAYKVDTFIGRSQFNSLPYNKEYKKRDKLHSEMVNKILDNPYCYLTGEKIDLKDSNSYQLDHIIPYHISKDNSINNLGLLLSEVNCSKAHLTINKYIELCKKVLTHNNYKVEKIRSM